MNGSLALSRWKSPGHACLLRSWSIMMRGTQSGIMYRQLIRSTVLGATQSTSPGCNTQIHSTGCASSAVMNSSWS